MVSILGYTDPMSVAAGDTLRVMVSCESGAPTYRAQLVRLLCGDDHPRGPGFREAEVRCAANGEYPARRQATRAGSYAIVPARPSLDAIESFTLLVLVWPTTPQRGRQGLIGRWSELEARGFGLFLDEHGAAELCVGDGRGPP